MDNITTLVSSVGFPCAMCLLLFWYMTKQNEYMSEQNKLHQEETASLKDTINRLELAITTLINKMES